MIFPIEHLTHSVKTTDRNKKKKIPAKWSILGTGACQFVRKQTAKAKKYDAISLENIEIPSQNKRCVCIFTIDERKTKTTTLFAQ